MLADYIFESPPSQWEVTSLGEVCGRTGGNIQTGPFGSQLHASDYVPFGIPSIMPENLSDNRVNTEGIAHIRQEDATRLSRYLVHPGDIVYSRRGDVTKRALAGKEHDGWLCGTGCLRVRFGSNQVNPRFAFYYLGHPLVREWISRHAIGATLPNLNTSILSGLPFLLPPPGEQAALAEILGVLDDKIELNRKMNETVEAIARAIFKSWFVDFDPVRAKSAGRQTSGMDAATAALFPDSFQASQVGMVPKGWSPTAWGKLVSLEYGKALSNYSHEDGAYPVYGTNGRIGSCSEPLCRHPGIVIGRKGAYRGVHFSRTPFFAIDTAFYVVPKTTLEMRWAWYEMLRNDINGMDSGSAIPSTSREDFYGLPVVVPPLRVQQQFAHLLNACWDHQARNEEQDRTLAAIRDTLLPKLISGEIRVRDAEKLVEKTL